MSHVDGLVGIPGGEFRMGSDEHYPEEAPVHRVRVDAFAIDRYPVTNRRFAAFVEATGYVTVAERPLDPADFPGAPAENLVAGLARVHDDAGAGRPAPPEPVVDVDARAPPGGTRRGRGRSLEGRDEHPVVHVAYEDAEAYAAWAGQALPTEAEWELAARGGLDGRDLRLGRRARARRASASRTTGTATSPGVPSPGYGTTTPVGSFPPNGYGLFDMAGNVWEWTSDWYTSQHAEDADKPCCVPRTRAAAASEESLRPGPAAVPRSRAR